MARFRFRLKRAVPIAAGVLAVVLFLRGCVVRPAASYLGGHFNRGRNAVWLGVEWLNSAHSDSDIAALAADLDKHQIATVYVYASYLKADGSFNPSYSHAAEFLAGFRAAQPAINIQAWIGLPLGYTDLTSAAVRQKIAGFCGSLIAQYGFDGIHLDPEPVNNRDQGLLLLLDQTRAAIGKTPILSLAARQVWPIFADSPALDQPSAVLWSAGYYRAVAERVDQIAVMTYDSLLPSPVLYRLWSRFQVITISKALDGTGVELLIGVPTSEEETSTHHAAAENMQSGLSGIIDGLNDDESRPSAVTGVAIYPYWETDAAEWALYDRLWLR